jgi:anti-sigma factor ChrR (cupin superfamily)
MMGLPTCQEVGAAMTDYMEGALPFRKRLGIRIHLMMCDLCSGLHRRLMALPRFAKDLLKPPAVVAPPEAQAALDQVLRAIRKDKGPDR